MQIEQAQFPGLATSATNTMQRSLDALADDVFDLVIVGGGITGAGVALEATLRGGRVALIDKGDFASGTSSVSSKLIHGGLRYLEQGHFHLVHESLLDRRWLVEHAPHLVQPLRFVLPFYQGTRVAAWQWRLGLTLYDLLAGAGNLQRSRPVSQFTLTRGHPDLKTAGLRGGAAYFDAQMDDARLCIEVIQSACRAGAQAANYLAAVGFEKHQGKVNGVWARDRLTEREILIRGRLVLNASGPWVDQVSRLAGDDTGLQLQPTKGAHLLAPGRGWTSAYLLLHPRDGRVFFAIPWMGKTLIGATDTFTPVGPDELEVTADDVAYLLEGFNAYIQPGLETMDILGTFAGLRPLLRSGPDAPSRLSREWRLWQGASGLWSVAGGKYTTFRSMARQIVTMLSRSALSFRALAPATMNHLWQLDGAPAEPWPAFLAKGMATLANQPLKPNAARHLLQRYGRRAFDVAKCLDACPAGAAPLWPGEPDLALELPYQREHEMALFPADHFLRRMRLGMYCPEILKRGTDPAPA